MELVAAEAGRAGAPRQAVAAHAGSDACVGGLQTRPFLNSGARLRSGARVLPGRAPKVRFLAALAALVLAPAAVGQRSVLMPGVTYDREVSFPAHGPVVMHVCARRDRRASTLKPTLSNDVILGQERVTQMQRRL